VRTAAGVAVVLLAVVLPARAPAQVAVNRAGQYLLASEAGDVRALWVNPGRLAVAREASLFLEVTARDPGPDGRLGQVSAGFNSRGFAVGYQRDAFGGGVTGHTWRVGIGTAAGGLALGSAVAMYRGATRDVGWDIGLAYTPGSRLTTTLLVANIGEPTVRGIRQELAVIPALTLAPIPRRLTVSAQARQGERLEGFAFGAGWTWAVPLPGALFTRLDTDRELRRASFAFGLAVGRGSQAGVVVTTPGDVADLDAASASGLVTRSLDRR
jgi:hypothetical protein